MCFSRLYVEIGVLHIGKNEFIKYNDFPIWTYHFEFDFLLMGNFLKMFIMELFVFVIDMFNCLL